MVNIIFVRITHSLIIAMVCKYPSRVIIYPDEDVLLVCIIMIYNVFLNLTSSAFLPPT